MPKNLLKENLDIEDIVGHYTDITQSLRLYFSKENPDHDIIFFGESPASVKERYHDNLREVEWNCILNMLAALEAAFRLDYLYRSVSRVKRDRISVECKKLYRLKQDKARLEADILDIWRRNTNAPKRLIGDLIAAYKLRHWLAHGRYWTPKLGRVYNFYLIYKVCRDVLNWFPLYG
jgi:hypothetical protein